MEHNKVFQWLAATALLVAVGGLVAVSLVAVKPVKQVVSSFGTSFTGNTSSGVYTDGQDARQNLQALVERANRQVLDMTEVFPTTTLSASDLCSNSFAYYTATSTKLDLLLPSASALASSCLDQVGQTVSVLLYNASTTAAYSTIIAGSGMDLLGSPTTTAANADLWAGGDYRRLTVTRDANGNVKAELSGLRDAD